MNICLYIYKCVYVCCSVSSGNRTFDERNNKTQEIEHLMKQVTKCQFILNKTAIPLKYDFSLKK